jgi:hypothetical protein
MDDDLVGLCEPFQQGAARTMERVLASLRKHGAECTARRVFGAKTISLTVNGEVIDVVPWDGRIVLRFDKDYEVIGVRKTAHGVAEEILYQLPSVRGPRMVEAKRRSEEEQARRVVEEQARAAAAKARWEQILAEHETRKQEVIATKAAAREAVEPYRGNLPEISCWYSDPRQTWHEPEKGSRFPWKPGTVTAKFETVTPDELCAMVAALAAHRSTKR